MRDDIVGICRFSFLGKCDWFETKNANGDMGELLARRARLLYAPDLDATFREGIPTLSTALQGMHENPYGAS